MQSYAELWLAIKGLSFWEFIGLYFMLSLWFGRTSVIYRDKEDVKKRVKK